jgi:hypothetical protein
MSVKQRVLEILSDQYIFLYLVVILISKIKSCHLFLRYTNVSSLMSIQQKGLKILSSEYIHVSRFTLDLLISKSIGVIESLGCISVLSLMSVKHRVLSIFEWSVYSYVQFDP